MGVDVKGYSSLEDLDLTEAVETVEAVEETENLTAKEEEDLLGREINNLSPLSFYNYLTEEEAVNKVKLLDLKIKLLKEQMEETSVTLVVEREILRLKTLRKEIINNVKIVI